jgi:endonuclease/exonuclease/phosphatase family metal-dependent hydrolase
MTRLFLLPLPLLALLTLGVGEGPVPPTDLARIRVMTWNVQKGLGTGGDYDLARIAEVIAREAPDIVGVQEIVRNHASFRCDDQPRVLAETLTRLTGRMWAHAYKRAWWTKKRGCVDSGRGDGVETEGLALLAPEPFQETADIELWNGRVGLMGRLESRPDVAVVVTHLAASARNRRDRVRQLEALLPWVAKQGPSRVLMGDFNAAAANEEMQPVLAAYADAWVELARRGKVEGSESTRAGGRGARIDYVFYPRGAGLVPESIRVVDTSGVVVRSEASDHRPVVATFRLEG